MLASVWVPRSAKLYGRNDVPVMSDMNAATVHAARGVSGSGRKSTTGPVPTGRAIRAIGSALGRTYVTHVERWSRPRGLPRGEASRARVRPASAVGISSPWSAPWNDTVARRQGAPVLDRGHLPRRPKSWPSRSDSTLSSMGPGRSTPRKSACIECGLRSLSTVCIAA